jgi:hypothetical protein
MSIFEMTHGMTEEEREEALRMFDLQGQVEVPFHLRGLASVAAAADRDDGDAMLRRLYSGDYIDWALSKGAFEIQLPNGERTAIFADVHAPKPDPSAEPASYALPYDAAFALYENDQEAQRMIDLQGCVAPFTGTGDELDEQSPEYQAWCGLQGYIEQRLRYCP